MPMNNLPLISTRISASAGSGKTYQLSLRFISLLVLGVSPVKMIALTFTRKAAAEFFNRIMSRLAEGALDEVKAARLASEVVETIQGSAEHPGLVVDGNWQGPLPEQKTFLRLLQEMVHQLDRLNMGTLDSFFSRMARVLAIDLGITKVQQIDEYKVDFEQSRVLQQLYERLDNNNELDSFLMGFQLATYGRENERMDTSLRDFVKQNHDLLLENHDKSVWAARWLVPNGRWWDSAPNIWELQPVLKSFQNEIQESMLNRLQTSIEAVKTGETFEWPTWLRPLDIRHDAGEISYCRKSYLLSPSAARGLKSLCASMVKTLVSRNAMRMQGMYSIMEKFEKLYDREVRGAGMMTFNDIARLLLPNEQEERSELLNKVQFRLDGWFDHWMLDEFQDTSMMQWHIVRPFLDEIVQDPDRRRTLFIVGDSKQSIYQWRGGSPKIFDSLASSSPWKESLVEWEMDNSYRSSPVILDFVNLVCDYKHTAPEASAEAVARWHFRLHKARGKAATLEGFVRVKQFEGDRRGNFPPEVEREEISKILNEVRPQERGLTCAILVGTNHEAAALREWLTSDEGGRFEVEVESDVEVGTDTRLGVALIDFFKWLYHPGDRFAWKHVIHSPLHRWLVVDDEAGTWSAWRRIYECSGVSAVLTEWEHLIRRDAPELLNDFIMNRFITWKEESAKFDDGSGEDLEAWLRTMKAMKKREHASTVNVQILTWHKAKGLEFDMVILPMGRMKNLGDATHLRLLKNEDEFGNVLDMIPSLNKRTVEWDDDLLAMRNQWVQQQEYEGFCKLYVALTRAKRALYLIVKQPKKENKPNNMSSCTMSTIIGHACNLANLDQVPFTMGRHDWFEDFVCQQSSEITEDQVKAQYQLAPPMRLHRDSVTELVEKNQLSPYSLNRRRGMRIGTLVHQLLERLEWLDDMFQIPTDIDPEVSRVVINAIESEDFKKWLQRPDDETLLMLECPVSGVLNGVIVSGKADRVMLRRDCLTVLDYKTDAQTAPVILMERHANQLRMYRDLLCRVYKVPPEKSQCVILAVSSGKAVVFS